MFAFQLWTRKPPPCPLCQQQQQQRIRKPLERLQTKQVVEVMETTEHYHQVERLARGSGDQSSPEYSSIPDTNTPQVLLETWPMQPHTVENNEMCTVDRPTTASPPNDTFVLNHNSYLHRFYAFESPPRSRSIALSGLLCGYLAAVH